VTNDRVDLRFAVAILMDEDRDMTAQDLRQELTEIGIEVSRLIVTGLHREFRRTVKEIDLVRNPEPKKKRYRVRTWWPDG
jgi:hypothetical protein